MFLWILFCTFLAVLLQIFRFSMLIHEAHPGFFRSLLILILSPAIIAGLAMQALWKSGGRMVREKKAPWALAMEAIRRREKALEEARKEAAHQKEEAIRQKEEDARHYREYLRRGRKY